MHTIVIRNLRFYTPLNKMASPEASVYLLVIILSIHGYFCWSSSVDDKCKTDVASFGKPGLIAVYTQLAIY